MSDQILGFVSRLRFLPTDVEAKWAWLIRAYRLSFRRTTSLMVDWAVVQPCKTCLFIAQASPWQRRARRWNPWMISPQKGNHRAVSRFHGFWLGFRVTKDIECGHVTATASAGLQWLAVFARLGAKLGSPPDGFLLFSFPPSPPRSCACKDNVSIFYAPFATYFLGGCRSSAQPLQRWLTPQRGAGVQ